MTGLGRPPMYSRMLRLRHVRPSGMLCFLFFEGTIALGVLLALAELVSWWTVPVLPVAVAGTVKLNDLVAGALVRGGPQVEVNPAGAGLAGRRPVAPPVPSRRPTRQVSRDLSDILDPADSPGQRFRQSARRRYR
jgi:hypothetical protein